VATHKMCVLPFVMLLYFIANIGYKRKITKLWNKAERSSGLSRTCNSPLRRSSPCLCNGKQADRLQYGRQTVGLVLNGPNGPFSTFYWAEQQFLFLRAAWYVRATVLRRLCELKQAAVTTIEHWLFDDPCSGILQTLYE